MMRPSQAALRVGIDIGGTFTDLAVLSDAGIMAVGKALTTHHAPAEGVIAALRDTLAESAIHPSRVAGIVHGTTLVTNALIERRGAVTAVVTNEGFRDVIEMGREHRYDLYDLQIELPRPLVPRHLRFGVTQRSLADGSTLTDLDEGEIRALAQTLRDREVEAVAVSLLHSYQNPEPEQRIRRILAEEHHELRVAISSEVNPEIREYERLSTTVANVYVQGVVEDYLQALDSGLSDLGVASSPMIMLSNGGITSLDVARRHPIRMLESGPAGGALGAVAFGSAHGDDDLLAFDMGGTTAKACIVEDGHPLITREFEVDRLYRLKPGSGLPVRAPVIDLIEIGAGGGSIARVDALGMITVGPDSAGSQPGPACYGAGGTQPTVTDADLVLGLLGADSFLGGRMTLDPEAARMAIEEHIARPLGVAVEEAAWGIHATVNENMANAARVHAIERGVDVTGLTMFTSGGNGPLHGPGVAASLGQRSILVPPAAGVLSAVGFLAAAPAIDVVRSSYTKVDDDLAATAESTIAEMKREGASVLAEAGVDTEDMRHQVSVDMRFVGQGQELEVPVPGESESWSADLAATYRREYAKRFGEVSVTGIDLEVLTWRVRTVGPRPSGKLEFTDLADQGGRVRSRRVYDATGGWVDTPVLDRHSLRPGLAQDGPALLHENESTVLIPADAAFTVLDDRSIRIDLGGRR